MYRGNIGLIFVRKTQVRNVKKDDKHTDQNSFQSIISHTMTLSSTKYFCRFDAVDNDE